MLSTLRARVFSWPTLVVLVAVVVVAELVVPRLSGGSEELTAADKAYARVCRAHGGTPSFAAGSGDYVKDGRFCEIRYGGDAYEMYAVHPEGFSASEAARARRTCRAQEAQSRADAKAAHRSVRTRYIWHERPAICQDVQTPAS